MLSYEEAMAKAEEYLKLADNAENYYIEGRSQLALIARTWIEYAKLVKPKE